MKECCDNPDVNYDTYNPGEVRLYGRIPDIFSVIFRFHGSVSMSL